MLTDEVKKKIEKILRDRIKIGDGVTLDTYPPINPLVTDDFGLNIMVEQLNSVFTEMVEGELDKYQKGLVMWSASNVADLEIGDKTVDLTKVVFEVMRNYKQYLLEKKGNL